MMERKRHKKEREKTKALYVSFKKLYLYNMKVSIYEKGYRLIMRQILAIAEAFHAMISPRPTETD
jgi:hypothetical protein